MCADAAPVFIRYGLRGGIAGESHRAQDCRIRWCSQGERLEFKRAPDPKNVAYVCPRKRAHDRTAMTVMHCQTLAAHLPQRLAQRIARDIVGSGEIRFGERRAGREVATDESLRHPR